MPAPFPPDVLAALRELSALPYENLSKIVAFAEVGNAGVSGTMGGTGGAGGSALRESALVLASDWLGKTQATGAGGTCFSLTWWLERRLKAQGHACAFLMGDKGGLKNIHCGLRFDWKGRSYLLDPGYMIFDPLPLPEAGLSASAFVSPNEIRIEDLPALPTPAWRLWSGPRGDLKPRFDFRRAAVSESEFLSHWEASYSLPMMGYPVLNRLKDGVQYYLQKRSLLIRTAEGGDMRKLSRPEMMEALGVTFGIPEGLAREALAIVTGRTPDFFSR